MAKVNLTTVSGGFYSQTQLNANFNNIRSAFDNTLSRDGTIPNMMEADLDMNSEDIINVNSIYTDNLILGGSATLPALVSRSQEVQYPGAAVTTLTTESYYVGNDSLSIYIDGDKQIVDVDYSEVGDANSISTEVTMTAPFAGTEEVEIIIDATYQKGECVANPAIVNWVSLADYICAGDDNDTALTSAISDACAQNRAIYIPAGEYTFSQSGQVTNCSVSIFGDGPGLTILKFDGCNGFSFTYSAPGFYRAYVGNMSILQEDEGVYSAIIMSNSTGTAGEGYHNIFENLDFVYQAPAAGNFSNHCWEAGININGISDGTIRECIWLSNNSGTYDTAFIKFNNGEDSYRWSISGNSVGYSKYGIFIKTDPGVFHEGLVISDNDFTNIDYAIYHDFVTGDDSIRYLNFNNNLVIAAKDGIRGSILQPNIHDNIILHDQTVYSSTNGEYSCVYLEGISANGFVHHNQFGVYLGSATTVNGVTLDGTEVTSIKYIDINGNVINYAYEGIVIQNNVESCNWDHQMYGANITTRVDDSTATSNRNYHVNGASTHYRTDDVVDITTAVSIPTAYQVPYTYFDNSKDELDLTPVTTDTITIPEHIEKVRVTAVAIIRSDAVPTPGTTIHMGILGTNVDGDPLPAYIGAVELPAAGNGEYLTLSASAAVVNVVAGSTIYVQVWSSAALAKSTIRGDLYIENVT